MKSIELLIHGPVRSVVPARVPSGRSLTLPGASTSRSAFQNSSATGSSAILTSHGLVSLVHKRDTAVRRPRAHHFVRVAADLPRRRSMYHKVVRNRNSLHETRVERESVWFQSISLCNCNSESEHRQRLDATCMCVFNLSTTVFNINVSGTRGQVFIHCTSHRPIQPIASQEIQ